MDYVSGEILNIDGFKKGFIGFKENKILDIGKGNPPKKPIRKGLIVPSFVNSHTHIGDSFIKLKKVKIPRDVKDLVAPPNGLKHKMLKEATNNEIIDGMQDSIKSMIKSGITHFCDFRENGINGIKQIKKSIKFKDISSTILSRPTNLDYNREEINLLLNNSDGIGLSSISDWDFSVIKKISKETRKKQKIFAIHASERVREDIDKILDLKPNFLIHMNKATKSDLEIIKDNKIPIVICPRSNDFFDMKPNYNLLKKIRNTLLIGTDNCMINTPNIIEEIKLIRKQTKVFSKEELLKMITITPRKVLNLRADILCLNSSANLVILDKKSLKVLYVS